MCVSGNDVACFYDDFSINRCSDIVIFLVLFYPSMISYLSTKASLVQFKFNGCLLNSRKYEIDFANDYQNKIILILFSNTFISIANGIWF
jgi:hypothetical protein